MRTRTWALATLGLYALSLFLLTGPLIFTAFYDLDAASGSAAEQAFTFRLEIYGEWGYWLIVGVLTLLEALFLLAPIQIERKRPVRRGRWITMAVVAGLLMGLLAIGLVASVASAVWGDHLEEWHVLTMGLLGVGSWIIWAIVFWTYARRDAPATALRRTVDRLIKGSVVELLVAVPCHIIVRQKDVCCAHGITFIGMATGFAVLLFAFGPGALFLFVKRVRDRRRELSPAPEGS